MSARRHQSQSMWRKLVAMAARATPATLRNGDAPRCIDGTRSGPGPARFDVFDIYAANFDGSDLIPSTMSSAFIGHNLDARFFVFFVLFFGVLGCSGPRDVSTNIFVTFYGEKTVQQFWCLIHN